MKKNRILVAGGSGYVGGRLVPRLLLQGYDVTCLARNPDKLTGRRWKGAKIVQGDVLDPSTLAAALKNIDVAYYLVHAMGGKGDFKILDAISAKNFGAAAATAGIKRIIYLGGLGDEKSTLSSHLQSRQQTGAILGRDGVPVTELRASIILGSGSASFEIIRDLAKKLPLMITPRWVNSLCEPIAIDDVLAYLLACLNEPRTIGQILEIGGGQVMRYADMIRGVGKVLGKNNIMLKVPVLTPRLSAYWLNIVTSVPMSLALPLVEGLRNDTICRDKRILEWIPIPLTSFQKAVESALADELQGPLESRWTEAGGGKMAEEKTLSAAILKDVQTIPSPLQTEALFDRVQKVGGNTGWYYANWAWWLRGLFDRLIGGVGMRRGRRDQSSLRVGDAVDFWRVTDFEKYHRLKLRAEMKLPGTAWLEFIVQKDPSGQTELKQVATFVPHNWLGHLYWYILLPIHFFIFRQMAKRIARKT